MTSEENKQSDEAAIRRAIENGVKAVQNKDIDSVMTLYSPDVVAFDIVPPLRYAGADAFRNAWEEVFSTSQGPINYETRDLTITAGTDVAFAYSLNHMNRTLHSGVKADFWLRWTACFRKINGKWLIVHHQNSVPADLAHGKAVLDLKP